MDFKENDPDVIWRAENNADAPYDSSTCARYPWAAAARIKILEKRLKEKSGDLFIDVLDDYLAFRKNVDRGIDGPYFEYVYGSAQLNDELDRDRAELAKRFTSAIKRSMGRGK